MWLELVGVEGWGRRDWRAECHQVTGPVTVAVPPGVHGVPAICQTLDSVVLETLISLGAPSLEGESVRMPGSFCTMALSLQLTSRKSGVRR